MEKEKTQISLTLAENESVIRTWCENCDDIQSCSHSFSISNRAAFVSNAPVGSSAKIISGSELKLRAAATRCF